MIRVYPDNPLRYHVPIADWIIKLTEYGAFVFWEVWIIGHQYSQTLAGLARFCCCRVPGANAHGKVIAFFVRNKISSSWPVVSLAFMDLCDPPSLDESLRRIIRCGFTIGFTRCILIFVIVIRF